MMRIQVNIYADCYKDLRGYQGAEMVLPADPYVVRDALQRARVPEGGGYTLESMGGWPNFLSAALFNASPLSGENALGELNLLADAVSRMDEIQIETFEGALQLHLEETGKKTAALKELINLSACLDDYEFHPGVTDDLQLGRACMEGGMLDLVEGLPDEVAGLLDLAKVGKALRYSDHGTFTSSGYVYRGTAAARQDFYDGEHLPPCGENSRSLISLLIKSPGTAGKGSGAWLELPADEKALRWALISLGEESFAPCWIEEVRSPVMMLQDQLVGCEDIGKLNTLAGRLGNLRQAAPDDLMLMKYKAALAWELHQEKYSDPDELLEIDFLDVELDIAANLHCYDYSPDVLSPDAYGEYVLQSAGINTDDPAFFRFDFHGYGERMLEKAGYILTAYGAISRNGQEFVHEYTEPDQAAGQGMEMK
ncbi:hypothetical protein [uncultured Acetatifactor sp.]|uniref:hypothetical protein n=1 Tax=uncultured Acetatifactor sp. TaxID=1671927 RepID=UPI00262B49B5|nr:hypothetical protein [uncultured Acetatifactor sp.]